MNGFIYFLTNPAMPNLVKIGHTTATIDERIRQLNSTGVPSSFELAACFHVTEPARIERELHEQLSVHRFSENREFFVGSFPELLEASLSVLVAALRASTEAVQNASQPKSHSLNDKSVLLLQLLTGEKKNVGYSTFAFRRELNETELEIENRFANLKKLGLVTERRSPREWEGSLWRITSDGTKFLFDHDLVTEDMLTGRWLT